MPKIPFFVDYTYLHHRIALTMLHGIGPRKARKLIDILGNCEPLFTLSPLQLSRRTKLKKSFIEGMRREEALARSQPIVSFLDKHSIEVVFYLDDAYPRRLTECADAPLLLYKKGANPLNYTRWVSVVGTRNATAYGKTICKELIRSFQGKDIVVVSGLALGIDAYVHRYCIEFGVPTVAVLGHGLDRIYPNTNRELAKQILRDGALLTEFPPNTLPDRENFPQRNRIVAGLCDATIVVESQSKGGSLITADLANGYDRDVFAFPGSVFLATSSGCNDLIRSNKAHLIQSGKEVLTWMNWEESPSVLEQKPTKRHPHLTPIQEEITGAVGGQPIHIDDLATKTKMNLSSLNIELFDLLMSGVLEELPGKRFVMA
jgi:DNA processing protein